MGDTTLGRHKSTAHGSFKLNVKYLRDVVGLVQGNGF